jgi:AbrB family looped-hinge helix DNA binding protein
VTSKGQITIPAAMREALELREGDQVVFEVHRGKEARVASVGRAPDLLAMAGALPPRKPLPTTWAEERRSAARRPSDAAVTRVLDTNVLVRHLSGSRPHQATAATALLAGAAPRSLHLTDVHVAELVWVLESSTYQAGRGSIATRSMP